MATRFELAGEAGRTCRPAQEIDSTVYRLVQEALTNAVKHSQGEQAWVELVEHEHRLTLTVSDDGCGFEPDRTDGGYGLIGMRERVELVEGSLLIDSAPGRGTTIRAKLPARHRAGADGTVASAQRAG